MAQPAIFGEGSTPGVHDARWRVLAKIVGAAYDAALAPNTDNTPKPTDTRWKLIEKWNRIKSGV